jgi:hypothetical protein
MTRSSGEMQKVSLQEATITYLNASHGAPARWSGVLDGSGINQAMGGIVEWAGEGNPTTCLFTGKYQIDRAFDGGRSNYLRNLMAEKYPSMRFNIDDVWGYCDGKKPVVVVPMTKQVYYKDRTVDTAAGVVRIEGKDGQTVLRHQTTVRAGQLPGPVYPASLVALQREQSEWAAGRENQDRNGFGFVPSGSDAQEGNASEYLLRNKATGRLEYVTPVRLRGTSSQLFVAYEVTPADQVTSGKLNTLRVYALGEGDGRRVNVERLESTARRYISEKISDFFSTGGKLREFTPVDGKVWRAYGEIKGQVVFRLDISADSKIEPSLVELDDSGKPREPSTQPSKPGEKGVDKSLCPSGKAEQQAAQRLCQAVHRRAHQEVYGQEGGLTFQRMVCTVTSVCHPPFLFV